MVLIANTFYAIMKINKPSYVYPNPITIPKMVPCNPHLIPLSTTKTEMVVEPIA